MRPLYLFIILALSISHKNIYSQVFDWFHIGSGDSTSQNYIFNTFKDSLGNIFAYGQSEGDLHIAGQIFPTNSSSGVKDLFVFKINPQGNILWLKQYPGLGEEKIFAFSLDPTGGFVITGRASVPVNLGNGVSLNPGTNYLRSYIAKFNQNGDAIWANILWGDANITEITIDKASNIYFGGQYQVLDLNAIGGPALPNAFSGKNIFLGKLFPTGMADWVINSLNTNISSQNLREIKLSNNDSSLYITGDYYSDIQIGNLSFSSVGPIESFILNINVNGTLNWGKSIERSRISDLEVDSEDNIYIAGSFRQTAQIGPISLTAQGVNGDILLAKFNSWGDIIWAKPLSGGDFSWLSNISISTAGDIYANGVFDDTLVIGMDTLIETSLNGGRFVAKFNPIGVPVWSFQFNYKSWAGASPDMKPMVYENQKIVISGGFGDTLIIGTDSLFSIGNNDLSIAMLNDTSYSGVYNRVRGTIYNDLNFSCTFDSNENVLPSQILQIEPGPIFITANNFGEYDVILDTGNYQIKSLFGPPGWPMVPSCPDSLGYQLSFSTLGIDTLGLDFGLSGPLCPYLSVNISSNRRRVCSQSQTIVSYSNYGTTPEFNVYIVVTYPPFIHPYDANFPWTVNPDSSWTFNIGTLLPGQSGQIIIQELVDCLTPDYFGLSACTEVEIFPLNNCLPVDTLWSTSTIEVNTRCDSNSLVRASIINSGAAPGSDSIEYRIWMDSVVVQQGKAWLGIDDTVSWQFYSGGKTLRIQADQVPYHPDNQWVASIEEGCGLESGFIVSKGYPLAFPYRFPEARISTQCLPLIAAFDPNDKKVLPGGLGSTNIIPPQTRMEYTIRFQNTGTDTAFRVMIADTLSSSLDVNTFQFLSASHPYTFTILPTQPVVFLFEFDPISLPDSGANLLGSQGHVSFAISPLDSLPNETVIENFADIFFDYNPPVRTDTARVTISDTLWTGGGPSIGIPCGNSPYAAVIENEITFCGNNSDSIFIQAVAPFTGFGFWRTLGDSVIISNPEQSGTFISNLSFGNTTLIWEVILCDSIKSDTIIISKIENTLTAPIISGDSMICKGDSFQLMGPPGFDAYFWSTGDTTDHIYTFDSGMISLFVSDSNGCVSPPSEEFATNFYQVELPPDIIGSTSVCEGDTIILYASPNFGKFLWNNGDSTQTLLIAYTDSIIENKYYVVGFDSFGCKSAPSDTIELSWFPFPEVPQIISLGNDTLWASTHAERYYWSFEGIMLPDTTQYIIAAMSGYYTVIAENFECQSDSSSKFFHAKTSLVDDLSVKFQFYPNPTTGEIAISWDTHGIKLTRLRFFDKFGKLSFEKEIPPTSKGKLKWDLSILSTGRYLIFADQIFIGIIEKN